MNNKDRTQAVMDGLLRFGMLGGVIFTGLAAPNAIQIFGKSMDKIFNGLDKRAQEREYRRIIYYMKQRNLLAFCSESYEHGLTITPAGKKRLEKMNYDKLTIKKPVQWDGHWWLVFYDIPEPMKTGRDALVAKLRSLGFRQLQRSAWIHPFPCRAEIELITLDYGVQKYVSCVEILSIDNEAKLKKYFKSII